MARETELTERRYIDVIDVSSEGIEFRSPETTSRINSKIEGGRLVSIGIGNKTLKISIVKVDVYLHYDIYIHLKYI